MKQAPLATPYWSGQQERRLETHKTKDAECHGHRNNFFMFFNAMGLAFRTIKLQDARRSAAGMPTQAQSQRPGTWRPRVCGHPTNRPEVNLICAVLKQL